MHDQQQIDYNQGCFPWEHWKSFVFALALHYYAKKLPKETCPKLSFNQG